LVQVSVRPEAAFINPVVSEHFTPDRSIRIHILTLTEAFTGGDVVANELDDLENPVVVGRLSCVPKDVIRPAINTIDPKDDICR